MKRRRKTSKSCGVFFRITQLVKGNTNSQITAIVPQLILKEDDNMLMPSIFGESLFDDFDNLMNFSFPDVDKTLYGKHAKNMMKTDRLLQ